MGDATELAAPQMKLGKVRVIATSEKSPELHALVKLSRSADRLSDTVRQYVVALKLLSADIGVIGDTSTDEGFQKLIDTLDEYDHTIETIAKELKLDRPNRR